MSNISNSPNVQRILDSDQLPMWTRVTVAGTDFSFNGRTGHRLGGMNFLTIQISKKWPDADDVDDFLMAFNDNSKGRAFAVIHDDDHERIFGTKIIIARDLYEATDRDFLDAFGFGPDELVEHAKLVQFIAEGHPPS